MEKKNILDTDIYCITSDKYAGNRSNLEVVSEMIEAGVDVIQYREKNKSLKEQYNECVEIREMTEKAGVTFIVNDYVDLAIMVGADGIHLGQDDLPVREVRNLVGPEMIIGLSTHSPKQAQRAEELDVNYIGVGPLFKTPTKDREPVGLEYLDFVVNNIDLPFVAIGGINEENITEVKERGARCICMVSEIVKSDDIVSKIESIRNILK